MFKKLLFLTILILFCFSKAIYSQDFSSDQKKEIGEKINQIIEDYQEFAGLSKDGQKISQQYVNDFSKLFSSNDAKIFNNLDPYKEIQKDITLVDYIVYIRSYYPTGLDVKLTWNKSLINTPVKDQKKQDKYYLSIPVDIKIMGVYKTETILNKSDLVYFTFEFNKKNDVLSDFSIMSVQKEKPEIKAVKEKEIKKVKEPSQSKTFLSLSAVPMFTQVYSHKIFSDDHWDAWGEVGYSFNLGINFLVSNSFGILTGIGTSTYKTSMKLEGYSNENVNNIRLVDKDGDVYFRYIDADIEEINSFTYLNIPIGFSLQSANTTKFGFYLNFGVYLSYMMSSNYEVKGNSTHKGYYPDYHIILYDLPEYDFTSEDLDYNEKWDIEPLNLSYFMSGGTNIPFSKSVFLSLGPYLDLGLKDLGYEESRYKEDFVTISGDPGNLLTRGYGALIKLSIKL